MSRSLRNVLLGWLATFALVTILPGSVRAVDDDEYWIKYWDGHWQRYRSQQHSYYYGAPRTPYDNNPYFHAFPSSSNNGYPNPFYYQHPHFHYTRAYNMVY